MRKVLKWLGIVLGSLVGLIVLAVIALNVVASICMTRTYDFQPQPIAVPSDEASIAAER
jgi:hypothetical protein